VANAGDSRCVLSTKDECVAMSLDHKPDRPDEQERIPKAGGFVIHNRVMGGLAVSRAIGDCDFKSDGLFLVIPDPEVKEHKISSEDKYLLLACDGLFDVMQNDAACRFIKREFKKGLSCTEAAAAIGAHAVKTLHSQDNVSVVIVRFEHAATDNTLSTASTSTSTDAKQASAAPVSASISSSSSSTTSTSTPAPTASVSPLISSSTYPNASPVVSPVAVSSASSASSASVGSANRSGKTAKPGTSPLNHQFY